MKNFIFRGLAHHKKIFDGALYSVVAAIVASTTSSSFLVPEYQLDT